MSTNTPASTNFETDHGEIPVDSGRILLVDPCHIPDDLLAALTTPNAHGVSLGVVVGTPSGDGFYPVLGDEGVLLVVDPYGEHRLAPWHDAPIAFS